MEKIKIQDDLYTYVKTSEEWSEYVKMYNPMKADSMAGMVKAFKNGRVWRIPRLSLEMYILEQSKLS